MCKKHLNILLFLFLIIFYSKTLHAVVIKADIDIDLNTEATITATPISFIEGDIPDTTFSFTLPQGSSTISLPVKDDGTPILQNSLSSKMSKIGYAQNKISISTDKSKAGSKIKLNSIKGRLILSSKLDALGRASINLNTLSQGIYFLSINGKNINQTFKLLKNGTDNLKVFGNEETSIKSTARVFRASEAVYSFTVTPTDDSFEGVENQQESFDENGTSLTFTLTKKDQTISEKFKEILDSATYHELFPNRYGFGVANSPWDPNAAKIDSDGDFDFYTYRSLIAALEEISKIRIEIWLREGVDYAQKVKWFNKETNQSKEIITHDDYFADWNIDKPEILSSSFDYGDFCNEGSLEMRKRELCAFLANISHETTGQGSDFEPKTWGLYWREEVAWQKGSTQLGYRAEGHATYPPSPGKSYHGRGPIQISWNYNYGQVSEFLYGDKQVFLDNPEMIIETDWDNDGLEDATIAYMTAIWFWMYPQAPKPSCHDVMVENWQPTADDIAKGRDASRFGMTINVINGGQECNKGDNQSSPKDRKGYYRHYASIMNVSIEDYCDCGSMQYW